MSVLNGYLVVMDRDAIDPDDVKKLEEKGAIVIRKIQGRELTIHKLTGDPR